ncbi:TonB family protein [Marinicella sediminis]|uniref:Protein TonB n=1 Tax=Marinicella sediminis TaxID=1792834 RepID=A0ABV7J9C2_9GAMM|nr:TonB family protein [Marinicella sediminis]
MSNHLQIVLLFLLLTVTPGWSKTTQADILTAIKQHEQGHHQQAFDAFKSLAALGSNQARYHLAHMYFNGEGVQQDVQLAYAWSQLIGEETSDNLQNLRQIIQQNLTSEQLLQASQLAKKLNESWGDDAILSQLAPIKHNPDQRQENNQGFNITMTERAAPRYPKREYLNGTQGWVRVAFKIFPDGSVRDPYILESVPNEVFDEVTIEAISKFRFSISFDDQATIKPIPAVQMVQYVLNEPQEMVRTYQQRLHELKQKAEAGHPAAQYYYALAASSRSLIKDYVDMPEASVNNWLLKAAQNGHSDAQFQLGYNIYYGKGCQQDKQRGINWMVEAAQRGHARAARQAYEYLITDQLINTSDHPPEYWLKLAAEAGDPDSQLAYAQHLLQAGQLTKEDTSHINDLLESYQKSRDRSVSYYQAEALLHEHLGNPKKAKRAQKKATKLANKLGWDLAK